jgi:hypothetical protein
MQKSFEENSKLFCTFYGRRLIFMKTRILLVTMVLFMTVSSRPIELYYTEDGKSVKMLRGYPLNSDFTIDEQGDESWLVFVGHRIGPNGYMGRENKLTLGTLGKSKSVFTVSQEDFVGLGKGLTFSQPVQLQDISYILPDSITLAPFFVQLRNGEYGTLFVANQPTESPGARVVGEKVVNDITIIHLKYDIPKSKRGPSVLPKQLGIKALAIGFSEHGIRQAISVLGK